jgi:hypothetical protein
LAQEATAGFTGKVTDPSGAAIENASVTARDVDRGTVWEGETNQDGLYNLSRLPVGTYEVRAKRKGFQTAVHPPFTLVLNQNARIDFAMTIGEITQTVEVTGAPPLLQTQTTQVGSVVDSHTTENLPLASRNYNQLTLLTAGATTTSPTAFTGAQSTFNSGRPYINGNREQANNYLLDGMDNNETENNAVAYAPSVDAIEEFNVITQNASAEFGNYMGGIINATIKSGTNKLHGDVFEFLRNDFFNANDWNRNVAGLGGAPKQRWNEFGGAIGGPVKKDKLFFFADYQGSRFDTPATAQPYTVFTNLERTGNFSQIGTQLRDPRNGQPYAGNIIPPSEFSPAALKILNSPFYPAPLNGNLTNNQVNVVHQSTNGDQGDIKADWYPTESDHVFARYSQQNVRNPTTNSQLLLGDTTNLFPVQQSVIDYTRTFSPHLVNEFRTGVTFFPATAPQATNSTGQNLAQLFGIPGSPTGFLPGISFPNNSNIGGGIGNPAFGNQDGSATFHEATIEASDVAIISRGVHTMKTGFEFLRYRENYVYPSNDGTAGSFTFNGQYTGFAEADFLEGLPNFVGIGSNGGGQVGQRYSNWGIFFQDDWQVNTHLTLNLGLRWDYILPTYEVYNREINFGEFTGTVEPAGLLFNDRPLYNPYLGIDNLHPRLGAAWTPIRNTVVRAGFSTSSFLEGNGVNNRLTQNPPFNVDRQATYLPASGTVPGLPKSTLDQGFAAATSGCTLANVVTSPAACFQGATIHVFDPNLRPSLSAQWNLTLQHQFGNATTVQVGYVGQRSTHLMEISLMDQKVLNADGTISPSPYLAGNPTLASEIGHARLTNSDAIQTYQALQVVVQHRLSQGLEAQFNYTWGKCLSDAPGFFGKYGDTTVTLASNGQAFPQNTYNLKADYGPCVYDVQQNFTGYLSYDLPFGRNRMYGKSANKVVTGVLGDWRFNSVLTFHTGFPFSIAAPDVSGTGSGFERANCVGPAQNTQVQASAAQGGGYVWWNPNSFVAPTSGFGSCGVGVVRGPGYQDVDMSLSKEFPFTEHQNLEFRFEALNTFNSAVIAPQTYSTDSTGPQQAVFHSSPLYSGRQLQFALKFHF